MAFFLDWLLVNSLSQRFASAKSPGYYSSARLSAQQWARLWGTRLFKSFSGPFGLALAGHWLVDYWATN
jgi:hypothetical protein